MAVTRASMEAAILGKLNDYFAATIDQKPDFAQFLTTMMCDAIEDAIATHASFPVDTSALTAGGDPVTGTATITATCTIP